MDTKELVTDQYGRREARVEQNANDFFWGLDNWMHTADSDIYLRFKNGKFEVQKTLSRGEWGVDAGRRRPDLSEHERIVAPRRLRADAVLHAQPEPAADARQLRGARATTRTWSTWCGRCGPNPGTNRAYQLGIDRPDGTLCHFTSVCAPLIYRGDRLPAELYGNVFVAEPAANLVSRDRPRRRRDDAAGAEGVRARESSWRRPTSASGPVYLSNAPDGTLYIVDMYRGVIQQRADITEYLRDHIIDAQAGAADRPRPHLPRRARDDAARHHDAACRQLTTGAAGRNAVASERLVARHGAAAAGRARRQGGRAGPREARGDRARTGARGCTRCGRSTGSTRSSRSLVVKALDDPSRDVRMSAIRLAERWLGPSRTIRCRPRC